MLTITLLGTAATMPLPDRALTAAVAECGGHSLLFDCGEGTQTAARRAGVNLMKMDAVCLTHYHGDHIFGLPGLLLLAAAVAVMLFFLYGCMAGAVYSPRGRLVFIPLAQVSGSSTTSLFSAFIWKNRSCPPHGTMCGPI